MTIRLSVPLDPFYKDPRMELRKWDTASFIALRVVIFCFALRWDPVAGGNSFSRSNSFHRSPSSDRIAKPPPPVDPQLIQLSEALYRLDQNGNAARENLDWKVNTRSTNGRLFTSLDERILHLPTYSALIALFDNYEPVLGKAEDVTPQEREEQSDFLDAVIGTPVMQKAWDFLVNRHLVPSDRQQFKDFLEKIWFTTYKRRGQLDTSGFEHVFVGEVEGTGPSAPVGGLHNWIRYYLEEKAQHATFRKWKGQTKPDVFGLEFDWNGHHKSKSTMAIGESPEMSLAILTTCFLVVPNGECQLRMDNEPVSITTFRWDTRNAKDFYVASAYYDS